LFYAVNYSTHVRIYSLCATQKRSLRWPQDLDGKVRYVEFYVVNDHSQVSYGLYG